MFISQVAVKDGAQVVYRDRSGARTVAGVGSSYELARAAISAGRSLADEIGTRDGDAIDLDAVAAESRFLSPVSHPDPAHVWLTGTGLTHLGSAATRDAMHVGASNEENLTDSMRMFRMGLEDGKPKPGEAGVQPEWFYKGNGTALAAPDADLVMPSFSQDGGEEPELAGIYVIGDDGTPFRLGFALANEFSDHVTERVNYLYLAHSKLRVASVGPEIRIGDFPDDVRGTSRITRDGEVIWEKPFLSGEANMSHTLANLEHHHFKYELFRAPGDVHVHMFGTATLSFADGISAQVGDRFEIEAAELGYPLRNRLAVREQGYAAVTPL